MQTLILILVAAAVFGLCYLVDRCFTKLFRSKHQHRSGLAVRVSKTYGVIGTVLMVIGVLAMLSREPDMVLRFGGAAVLLMGFAMVSHYLTKGIFYDDQEFLVCALGKKGLSYRYADIRQQRLYLVQGGSVVIELHMADGRVVSLQSAMTGVYPFLDAAFEAWCRQTGRDPQTCDFHDPSKHWWFPHEEEN